MAAARWAAPEEPDPLDLVEMVAAAYQWEFDRLGGSRAAVAAEAQWRRYALTASWSAREPILQLVCTFEMEPPRQKLPQLYEILNRINDSIPIGAFFWWPESRLMVYRHGLLLAEGQPATLDQVDRLLTSAVTLAERFYPAMQLATWGGRNPEEALQLAIAEPVGHA